jgi:formate hydrogenlyase transcriptional activator
MDGISANTDVISSKLDYASEMVKQNIKVGPDLRFFRLVNDISALLVGARSNEIEKALDDCLAKLGGYFDAHQVALGQISSSGELLPSLRMWGDVASIDFLAVDPPGPEMVAYFIRHGSLTWNCLEDLDEVPQFREHCRQVNAVAGSMWLHRDFGSHVEGLALSGPSPKVWPEDTVDCLAVVGQVLFNAFYRRRAEAEAERTQRFEQAIAEVAATLVRVRADDIDVEINNALGQIGETTDADLCVFLRCDDPDASTYKVNYEWNVDAIDGPVFSGVSLTDDYPWLVRQLEKKRPLYLSNPDDFALEAKAEFELVERFGIRSMHWEPFEAAHGRCGYIGLGTANRAPQWPEGVLPQLGLFGNIVADAIDRQRADMGLEQAFKEIQTLKERLMAENETLRQEADVFYDDHELIGKSHAFRATIFQAEQVAPTDSTVLLLGETGTGKGLLARRIHELSGRRQHPLVTVNCAALPSSLIESELFGHEKGAFTGAVTQKIGRFELAHHGTIFLDEVGDLPTQLQAKLLRVLQDREFERLGSSTTRTVDVRVIAATNRDLDLLIEQGGFRADLYYRLGVFPVRAPALRERRSDIPLLIWFFISELQHRLGKEFNGVSAQAMATLSAYDWPGNVRELKNIIERAMILSEPPILRMNDWFPGNRKPASISIQSLERSGETIEEVERAHIEKVLASCDWRIRGTDGAAEHLGLKRTTLQSRMKKLGIERPTT